MSKTHTHDGSEQKETRDPNNLTPHPKNSEIYGDDIDQSFINRIEKHGIQSKVKVTSESHFTDAELTIIGGHRRVAAAKELGRPVEIEEVGPYETPEEEIEALLVDNDHRDKTPAQEIREVDQWAEVYRESPKLETDSAIEAACEHVSFGVTTYWDGKKVQNAAEAGEWGKRNPESLPPEVVETAKGYWESLKQGTETIGGAHQAVKEEKEDTEDTIPDTRGWVAPRKVAQEEIEGEEPVRAAFPTSVYRFKQFLQKTKPVRGQAAEDEADIRLDFYEDEIQAHSAVSKYSFIQEWFDVEMTVDGEGPVQIMIKHTDLANRMKHFDGEVRVELRGPEDSVIASHLVVADSQKVLCLAGLTEAITIPGSSIVRQEQLDNSPLSGDSS